MEDFKQELCWEISWLEDEVKSRAWGVNAELGRWQMCCNAPSMLIQRVQAGPTLPSAKGKKRKTYLLSRSLNKIKDYRIEKLSFPGITKYSDY